MTPLERLLAEAIPDGTFGGPRTPTPPRRPGREITPEQAAANHRVLADALASPRRRRHQPSAPDQEAA